ncbi:magnesium and cobalt transport protein CorA [Actinoplanes sp. NBRC 103695]|uniref:magnesium and cobalt transport protein CorA n=1 Tax=Actinoplanes sp. NBRC 103695 TaxID=3032202 RepID=UPI0024A126B4|nr:magnesium and cobalt transport protein CorA [Actinoplanes sp. NBRC 103695]GLY96701.1 magnesium transport protein CorA [Actinoplanes sp. NBRC 103695]
MMYRWLRDLVGPGRAAVSAQVRLSANDVVDCAVYTQGRRRPGELTFVQAAREIRRRGDGFVWLGLHEPDVVTMTAVGQAFGLHELTVEQAMTGGHRPAVEIIGDVVRMVLRTAGYVEHEELTETSEVVDTGDVTLLVGERFVISVRHGSPGALKDVRKELEQRPALLGLGPWAVAHAVCAAMVDGYLEVAGHVERDMERLEETAFTHDRKPGISHMYQLKREMVEFKRAVLPLQEPLHRILDSDRLPAGIRPYFVDVRGRLARTVERVAGFDDLLNSIMQARLAQVSIDQNNDMRKIASWAAIAAVQTAIAGIYGMNFEHMPELGWTYGYPAVIALMLGAAVLLYRRLKRVGWL